MHPLEKDTQKEFFSSAKIILKLLAGIVAGFFILSVVNGESLFNGAILAYIVLAGWITLAL